MAKGPNKWKSNLQRAVCEWLAAHPDQTARQLATRGGIDPGDMSRIVSGDKANLNADKARDLAVAMGLSVEDLVEGRSTPRTSPASAPIDATTDVRGTLRMLSLSALTINPLNPRKAFDDEHLAELAESIAAEGVLQNLVVAPAAKDGRHVVIAGGRRQRAIMKLVEQGRWTEDAPTIPCRILAGAEPRVRALALIENLQRVDLTAMEEAHAFDELNRLDDKLWTPAHIAEVIHRTPRFVQQRIKFARDLAPTGQRLLGEGKITVEIARTLTMAPKKQQTEILGRIRNTDDTDGPWTPGDVKEQLTQDWIESDQAFFDKSAWTGSTVVDEDTGTIWFTDKKLFAKLQRAAAAARVKALEGERKWARLVDSRAGQNFNEYDYNKVRRKDLSDTGAVVRIDYHGRVEILDGLVKRETASPRVPMRSGAKAGKNGKGKAIEKPEPPPFTNRLLIHASQTKTEYLQDAIIRRSVADEGDTAMCLAIMGLLGVHRMRIALREEDRSGVEGVQGPDVRARLRKVYAELVALAPESDVDRDVDPDDDAEPDGVEPDIEDQDETDLDDLGGGNIVPIHAARVKVPWFQGRGIALRVWDWLRFKSRDERIEIFSLLVADRTGFFGFTYHPKAEHEPFDLALVAHVGLNTTQLWRPDREWLDASRKARLEALARGIRLDPIPKSTTQLRDAIAARFAAAEQPGGEPLPPAEDWIPPEIMVLEKEALEQRLKPAATAVRPVTAKRGKGKGEREGAPA